MQTVFFNTKNKTKWMVQLISNYKTTGKNACKKMLKIINLQSCAKQKSDG